MVDLEVFRTLLAQDHGLCVVATRRGDAIASTVVNAGVLDHPLTNVEVVGFVARGDSRKLAHLRHDPTITITVRAGWQWATVEGHAALIGPDDLGADVDAEALRLLLREIFTAAGGTHDDWDAYDAAMRAERRTAVLVIPTRTYTNPT